jgi:hypothetical protein
MLININGVATNTTTGARDVQTVTRIQDLSDVSIPTTPSEGQLLIWNGSVFNWQNSDTVNADFTVTGNLIPYTLRANADTNNAFTFRTTWENYGVTDYDLSTTLITFKDLSSNRLGVNQWRTENEKQWYLYEAIDTGGGDDGSHISKLTLQGNGGAEITSSSGLLTVNPAVLLANASTGNALKFSHMWENYGTTDYDVTTRFVQYADPGNSHIVVQRWQTPQSNTFITVNVGDTGGGDNGTHLTEFNMQGDESAIKITDIGNNYAPLRIDASELHIKSWGGISEIQSEGNLSFSTLSGGSLRFNHESSGSYIQLTDNIEINNSNGHSIVLSNQPKMLTRSGHLNSGSEISLYRWNNSGSSALESGSQLALNFNMLSEDQTTEAYVGQFQVIYDSPSGGNIFNIAVNDTLNNQANAVEVRETHTKSQQPIAFPQFNQTDINAMSPANGWVVYNTTTDKLQVYAGGTWVDLH